MEQLSPIEADDGARAIAYLGRNAPWGDGKVGAFGLSYWGATPLAAAGRGDRSLTRYLKAIVVASPYASVYEYNHFDGVVRFFFSQRDYLNSLFLAEYGVFPGQTLVGGTLEGGDPAAFVDARTDPGGVPALSHLAQRPGCHQKHVSAAADTSGNFTKYMAARETRAAADRIRAATLMIHGHRDEVVWPSVQAGLFDQLPVSTPKAGVFGHFGHEFPDRHASGIAVEWERAKFMSGMVAAWYDHFLKGLDTGVDDWPVAQVQGSDGQWRAEPDWPTTGGAPGQLALAQDGLLGPRRPKGRSSFTDGVPFHDDAPVGAEDAHLTFVTRPLPKRLEVTGQPVLDLWVTLKGVGRAFRRAQQAGPAVRARALRQLARKRDVHLAAELEVIDASGEPVPDTSQHGFRSMRHLKPLVENRFAQRHGRPPPMGRPVHVPLRFSPMDLVVPEGGRLRLSIGGTRTVGPGIEGTVGAPPVFGEPSQPSLSFTRVTILHNCLHLSALRFVTPRARPDLLNVREADEKGRPLASSPSPRIVSDGGGLVRQEVCGRPPVAPE